MRRDGSVGYSLNRVCSSLLLSKTAKGCMAPAAATVPGLADPFSSKAIGGLGGKAKFGIMGGWLSLWMLLHGIEQLKAC